MTTTPVPSTTQNFATEIRANDRREKYLWMTLLVVSIGLALSGCLGLAGVNVLVYTGTLANTVMLSAGLLLMLASVFSLLAVRACGNEQVEQ